MGEGRNLKPAERHKRERKFYHSNVDKYFLCGCSPYELFRNTRSDIGENPSIADKKCKAQWEALTQSQKDEYGYEYDTYKFLQSFKSKLIKHKERNERRVKSDENSYIDETAEQIVAIESGISEQLHQAYSLAKRGNVEEAYGLIELVKAGETQRKKLLSMPPPEKKQVVCPISGNLLSTTDNDERLRAHFEGKQFRGWKKVKQFLDKYDANPPPKPRSKYRDSDRYSNHRRHRRSRSRSRSRSWKRSRRYQSRRRY